MHRALALEIPAVVVIILCAAVSRYINWSRPITVVCPIPIVDILEVRYRRLKIVCRGDVGKDVICLQMLKLSENLLSKHLNFVTLPYRLHMLITALGKAIVLACHDRLQHLLKRLRMFFAALNRLRHWRTLIIAGRPGLGLDIPQSIQYKRQLSINGAEGLWKPSFILSSIKELL
jgi:hypothetical protein